MPLKADIQLILGERSANDPKRPSLIIAQPCIDSARPVFGCSVHLVGLKAIICWVPMLGLAVTSILINARSEPFHVSEVLTYT